MPNSVLGYPLSSLGLTPSTYNRAVSNDFHCAEDLAQRTEEELLEHFSLRMVGEIKDALANKLGLHLAMSRRDHLNALKSLSLEVFARKDNGGARQALHTFVNGLSELLELFGESNKLQHVGVQGLLRGNLHSSRAFGTTVDMVYKELFPELYPKTCSAP